MILNIDITKQAPGIYVARCTKTSVLATELDIYDRIDTAIREEARNIPDGFAHFVEFTYHGMSTGTLLIQDAIERAEELADRLMVLISEGHRILEASGRT